MALESSRRLRTPTEPPPHSAQLLFWLLSCARTLGPPSRSSLVALAPPRLARSAHAAAPAPAPWRFMRLLCLAALIHAAMLYQVPVRPPVMPSPSTHTPYPHTTIIAPRTSNCLSQAQCVAAIPASLLNPPHDAAASARIYSPPPSRAAHEAAHVSSLANPLRVATAPIPSISTPVARAQHRQPPDGAAIANDALWHFAQPRSLRRCVLSSLLRPRSRRSSKTTTSPPAHIARAPQRPTQMPPPTPTQAAPRDACDSPHARLLLHQARPTLLCPPPRLQCTRTSVLHLYRCRLPRPLSLSLVSRRVRRQKGRALLPSAPASVSPDAGPPTTDLTPAPVVDDEARSHSAERPTPAAHNFVAHASSSPPLSPPVHSTHMPVHRSKPAAVYTARTRVSQTRGQTRSGRSRIPLPAHPFAAYTAHARRTRTP
ncbi:hypothetical protein B0H15DRAFT_958528 [Mycena belliarum]|uniref:Uncharacterized protein n=1 Tax=Mycena belliarum TaxID=1033014 RepID=A0AAD6XDD4_9AGAR|nr:hypothetical protein B0H15DRAFT_958528 [Mycena belliae]